MISENTALTDNYWIEGLDFSTPYFSNLGSSMKVSVSEGSFFVEETVFNEETQIYEKVAVVSSYPAFSFEVYSDNEFDVIYDIYLLEVPTVSGQAVHIDRTEMGAESFAHYEGKEIIKYTLSSFLVPANTTNIKDVEIKVNRVVKNQ